ncbi:MAG TPA: cytochrome c [Terriglobales bacterium]|nr:cytochrome c [Terriglobales bacterium]
MRALILPVLLFISAIISVAQMPQTPAEKPTLKLSKVGAAYTPPYSGKQMYDAYCASCHGLDGKGTGPAAALKDPIPDLTKIKKHNQGTYPAAHVAEIIRGDVSVAAHGSKDMPVWGSVLLRVSDHHPAEVQQRIANLTGYIQSLQR